MTSPFNLDGETVLITGGGSGLGLGMARCFITSGAKVVLVGRRASILETACAGLGNRAVPLVGDVTDLDTIPDLVLAAEKQAGPISVLVNNAGVHLKKSAEETSDAEFAGVLQTHVSGAFALSREVGRGMLRRGGGSVLFTASMASFIGMPKVVAYSAAKSAYLGIVRTLASEWGERGVRVNAIAPGWIASDMLEQALSGDAARRTKILGRISLGHFGEPDDIGWAAVFLASSAAKYITGTVIPVDGGGHMNF